MVYDFVAILFSYLAALWIRFDCNFGSIPREFMKAYYETIVVYGAFCILIFLSLRLYKSIWKFASYTELIRMILATAVTGAIYTFVVCTFVIRMPVSYFIFGIVLQFGLTLGVRFLYRFILLLRSNNGSRTAVPPVNVMLIGAGAAGQMIFRDIRHAKEVNERVCCFIDDNSNKWGRYIDGVEIFGGRDSILAACEKYQIKKIYLAIPSASAQEKRDILQICNETKCELMNLPGMYQLYTGQVSVSNMRKVSTEDLLGRDPIRQDMTEVYDTVIFMECEGLVLEIFVDSNHPERALKPEQKGLRHIALAVKDLEEIMASVPCEKIRTDWFGRKFTFAKDPDGQPIELKEMRGSYL